MLGLTKVDGTEPVPMSKSTMRNACGAVSFYDLHVGGRRRNVWVGPLTNPSQSNFDRF
jgi:hypothetical protein